jgi:hypothetical protein
VRSQCDGKGEGSCRVTTIVASTGSSSSIDSDVAACEYSEAAAPGRTTVDSARYSYDSSGMPGSGHGRTCTAFDAPSHTARAVPDGSAASLRPVTVTTTM